MFPSILMILVVIILFIALFFVVKNRQYEDDTGTFNSRPIALIVSAVMVVVLIVIAYFSCLYKQDPGEAKVLKSFTGEVVGIDTTEGMGFKAPWVSTVDYDIRNQVVSYVGDGSARVKNSKGDSVPVTGSAIVTQDKDGASASIDLIVRYSIEPGSVKEIYKQYGSQENFESKMVQNDVKSIVRNIPLKYSTTALRLNREEAAVKMQEALAAKWDGDGVVVDSVDLQAISYPENIETSLQAVQEAINNANKAKADLETAKIDAEKTRVEAQAQADYDQIVRCGAKTTTVKEIINGTETNVAKITPLQGRECENRLNEQVLTNKYIDALKELGAQGNVIVVPEGSTPLVQTPGKK